MSISAGDLIGKTVSLVRAFFQCRAWRCVSERECNSMIDNGMIQWAIVNIKPHWGDGVAQWVERRTRDIAVGVPIPCVYTHAYERSYTHVKNPVVHVRVWWITDR